MFQFFIFFGVQLGALYFATLILVEMPYLANGVFCCLMSKKNTMCSILTFQSHPTLLEKYRKSHVWLGKIQVFQKILRLSGWLYPVISSYIQLYPVISIYFLETNRAKQKLVNWNLHFPWNGPWAMAQNYCTPNFYRFHRWRRLHLIQEVDAKNSVSWCFRSWLLWYTTYYGIFMDCYLPWFPRWWENSMIIVIY